jgi:hypothetical protein
MEEFADVSRARASYQTFVKALNAGREIVRRAGVMAPPSIPDFEVVFKRLHAGARRELFAALREREVLEPAEAIRLWQPLVRRAFDPRGAPSVVQPARGDS